MQSNLPAHEKVRFRRTEIVDLDALPSAADGPALPAPRSRSRRGLAFRVMAGLGLLVGGIGCLVALALAAVSTSFVKERLRLEAQTSLSRLAGDDLSAAIGDVGVWFDARRGLVLEARDVGLAAGEADAALHLGSLRFGLHVIPLIRGELVLDGATIRDARVITAALPRSEGPGPVADLLDERGLVDPDRLPGAVFEAVRRALELVPPDGLARLELQNVAVDLGTPEAPLVVRVDRGTLGRDENGTLSVAMDLRAMGRSLELSAEAREDQSRRRVESLRLALSLAADPATDTGEGSRIGSGRIVVTGGEVPRMPRQLSLSGWMANLRADLADGDILTMQVGFDAALVAGAGKLEIERMSVASGRSLWHLNGAVGPLPEAADPTGETPSYRFELVSDGSTLAPEGSVEGAIRAAVRVSGRVVPDEHLLRLDQIGLRTVAGEVAGTAAFRFPPGMAPGIDLSLKVLDMPVAHVKQVWPWFASREARNWVQDNIYGGVVPEGSLHLRVLPGRLGNGVPLNAQEVWGNFAVRGTRFDTAGTIPPIRDGNGSVAFRGSDVDIELDSGTVFMASGRSVAASRGTLVLRDAHRSPLIGKLEIDVAGSADGVLELAGYEPIDVSRFIDFSPKDVSGSVTGTILADIPFQRSIPVESLDWRVALEYQNLALAVPFDGQTVSDAQGSIVVDPHKARIDARARLSGTAATLMLVEPLGSSPVQRERRIALALDDAGRDRIAPGLGDILSGTASVEVEELGRGKRMVKADLGRSVLSLPWVGWSKGAGVAASASFAMSENGGATQLDDFVLRGDSFAMNGSLTLEGGQVRRVRFPSARLNRNDSFSVDVQRQGRGYAVTVRGASLDARSVVRLLTADSEAAARAVEGVPISVDLKVDAVTGFHDEVLRDVSLSYAGTGSRIDRLEFAAVTRGGRRVTFADTRTDGLRRIAMQSADAGAVLRFLDIYERLEGGTISLALASQGNGPLRGQVEAQNFEIVNEPRLGSIVSTAPANDGRSLNQAVRGELDVSRVRFERGYAEIDKGTKSLAIREGVLRGPLVGATFQGTIYDADGQMAMTGTFMPAYGLNRLFGEIPIIGQILGNGRDRGLIGITFRLYGKSGEPQLQVNPLSVVAPGIFRSVFEFR